MPHRLLPLLSLPTLLPRLLPLLLATLRNWYPEQEDFVPLLRLLLPPPVLLGGLLILRPMCALLTRPLPLLLALLRLA